MCTESFCFYVFVLAVCSSWQKRLRLSLNSASSMKHRHKWLLSPWTPKMVHISMAAAITPHTLPPIRALRVNTESEHCDGGLYRPPVASSCKALHCEGTEYMLSELKWKFEIYCMQGLLAPRSWLWCGEETKRSHEVDEYPRISWEALAHSRPNKYVFWNKDMVMDSCALQLLFKSPSNYGGGWLSTRILLSGGPRRERCAN